MSRATGFVRFPDGSIKYTVYDGTSDVMCERLFGDASSAWDAWRDGQAWMPDRFPESGDVVYPVEVHTNYGSGLTWRAYATPDRLVSPLQPYDGPVEHRTPKWVADA